MNKEQAVSYLRFSGFSDEQIKTIEGAFACEDAISRQAVIDEISKARDINLGILPTGHRSYEDILRCVAMAYDMGKDHALNVLRSMPSVNPQKPICPSAGVDCEDCPAYEPKTRWIPVSERLPKDAYGCIVTVMDVDLKTQNEFENVLPYFVGYDGETWNNADGEPIPYEVIAWMKAPEPYKAEGSGEEMTDITAKPFDWNDNLSEEAIEDFKGIQKDLPYCTCQNIGMALAKLELLEKQGCKVIDPSGSSSEKPNKSEWEHDHEILKAYSDGANDVLESIKYLIEQYEHYLELLDADMKDGSATIVTKTKYAVYTEVVKQLKEVLESEDKE